MIDIELVKHWCALLRDERMTPDRFERSEIADTIEHLSQEVDAWRLETCRRRYIDFPEPK